MAIHYSVSKESINQINDFFTMHYDFKQWFFRLKTYDLLLDNHLEKFIKELDDEELKQENLDDYRMALKSEVVFTFFHMAEALFSLMYACRKSPVPWIAMRSMRISDLFSYVREEIVSGKISDEDVRFLFYNGIIDEEAKKESVVKSIHFIKEFLKRAGAIFLEHGTAYNEYKHGLRIMATQAQLSITPENTQNPKPIISLAGDAHVFLATELIKKDGKEEIHQIKQTTTTFDYKLYLRLCIQIFRLMSNLFGNRRQAKKLKKGDPMRVIFFHEEDLKSIFKEDPTTKFSFTFDYP